MYLKKRKSLSGYFTKGEIALWCVSESLIVVSFFIFDRENYLTLAASLIGVISLIFNAKGNPFGQFLMVIFSILYGIISFTSAYYGEMITYLGMTAPMAVFANLIPSTISVTTSFLAVYLTFRRSAFFAVGYAANDIVLIILWILAAISDISYLSVAICFVMFLINDTYGFINWSRMQKRQEANCIITMSD